MRNTTNALFVLLAICLCFTSPAFSADTDITGSFYKDIPLCAQIMDYNIAVMEQYAWDAAQEYKEDVEKMKIQGAKERSDGISDKNDTYTPSGGAGCNPGCLTGWMGDIDWEEMLVPCSWALGCSIGLFAIIYMAGVFGSSN